MMFRLVALLAALVLFATACGDDGNGALTGGPDAAVSEPAASDSGSSDSGTSGQGSASIDGDGGGASGPTDPFAGPDIDVDGEFCTAVSDLFETGNVSLAALAELTEAVVTTMPEGAPAGSEVFAAFGELIDASMAAVDSNGGLLDPEDMPPELEEQDTAVRRMATFPVETWIGWQCQIDPRPFFEEVSPGSVLEERVLPEPVTIDGLVGETFTWLGVDATITDAAIGWWTTGITEDEMRKESRSPELVVTIADGGDGAAIAEAIGTESLRLEIGDRSLLARRILIRGLDEAEHPDEYWFRLEYFPESLTGAQLVLAKRDGLSSPVVIDFEGGTVDSGYPVAVDIDGEGELVYAAGSDCEIRATFEVSGAEAALEWIDPEGEFSRIRTASEGKRFLTIDITLAETLVPTTDCPLLVDPVFELAVDGIGVASASYPVDPTPGERTLSETWLVPLQGTATVTTLRSDPEASYSFELDLPALPSDSAP